MSQMLTEKEASEVLSCSIAVLRKWRWLGKGPGYCKLGRLIRYSQSDLAAFLEANRVQPVGGGR